MRAGSGENRPSEVIGAVEAERNVNGAGTWTPADKTSLDRQEAEVFLLPEQRLLS